MLIVVVVIAILAAITITVFNGVQARAHFSKMQQDLSDVKKALEIYKADNGVYPDSTNCDDQNWNYQYGWCGWSSGRNNSFVPGITPKDLKNTPAVINPKSASDTYLYKSSDSTAGGGGGTRYYELIRYKPASDGGLSSAELANNPYTWTGNGYDGIAWGFKSDPTLPNW